ncbi:hypothetical protein [Streptomyces sp. NBC_00690]|uniref:hypothetical protein n=1 Tax=Streptomyces sp. NBC_00690 TaxID=2975808 RepID=UPI002E2B1A2F|nr:hypothetical protein [Streptomyces sp. NBC_00690]
MSWDKRLADPNATVREPRRAFDVAAGLSRLAQDAGYGCASPVRPTREVVPARDRLEVLSRWTLTQAGAAAHVKDLTTCIGDNGFGNLTFEFTRWIDLDIDGVQVFACMLYLARHPESAQFWWKLAAGAGHLGAAYCLYLHHLSCGELREAELWKGQLQAPDGTSENFFDVLESFAGYRMRHDRLNPVPTGCLAEFERLAERHEGDGLVYRPDRRLADRLHDLAGRH